MSARWVDLMPMEITLPQRPQPLNFAFREKVDERQFAYARSDIERQRLFDELKRYAAHKLADHIAAHCKWFDVSMPMFGAPHLQIELTINDRGAYVNYLPVERDSGRREGRAAALKACAESLPYGLADAAAEFYEPTETS